MNIFNRIVVVFLLIFILVFSIVVVVNKFSDLFIWTEASNRAVGFFGALNVYLIAGVFVALIVICILLLFLEFFRKKVKVAKLSETGTGSDMVTLKALNNRIEKGLSKIENMSDLKVKVIPKKEGLIINMSTKISMGINVEKKIAQIREAASEFVSKYIGFKVLKTDLTITGFTTQKEIRMKERKAKKEKEEKYNRYPG